MALISKRLQALTLFRKRGINKLQPTKTYEHCKNVNHVPLLKIHSDDLLRYFGISVSEDYKRLPSIYWLPKLHKNPTKTRFIIAAPTCSAKPLSTYFTINFQSSKQLQ